MDIEAVGSTRELGGSGLPPLRVRDATPAPEDSRPGSRSLGYRFPGGAICLLAVLAFFLFGFGSAWEGGGRSNRPRAVATYSVIYDFARQIAGDRAEVSSLVPVGTDPHTYEPKPGDIRRLAEADARAGVRCARKRRSPVLRQSYSWTSRRVESHRNSGYLRSRYANRLHDCRSAKPLGGRPIVRPCPGSCLHGTGLRFLDAAHRTSPDHGDRQIEHRSASRHVSGVSTELDYPAALTAEPFLVLRLDLRRRRWRVPSCCACQR